MRAFKPDRFYTVVFFVLSLLLGIKLSLLVYHAKITGVYDKMAIFLFASLFILSLFAFLYLIQYTVVYMDDGRLIQKNIFGVKELIFSELIDISVVDVKSRFIIFLITNDKFIMLSSLLSDFEKFATLLQHSADKYEQTNLPPKSLSSLHKIDNRKLARKRRFLKIALFLALLVVSALALKER